MMPDYLAAVANHLWQSTWFAVAAGLLALALRKNRSAVRYGLWLAASLKFLIPFAPLVTVGELMQHSVSRSATAPIDAVQPISDVLERIGQPFGMSAPVAARSGGPHVVAPFLLPAIWLCGFVAAALSWFRRWQTVRAAVRGAAPAFADLPIPVMYSRAGLEPGVAGIWRPVLLLPQGIAERLTAAQLAAVMAHEMCHVQRRDNLAMALHMVVETVFWFHPLVWLIRERLLEERERACDEAVMRAGCEADAYAEGILTVCRFCVEAPAACVSGVMGADLKRRIEGIVAQRPAIQLNFGKRLLLGVAAFAAVAAPVSVGVMHALPLLLVVQEQGPPPSEPPPPPARPPSWVATSPVGAPKTFEVASVKLSTLAVSGGVMRPGPGSLNLTNMTLEWLVSHAYGIHEFQIVGAPGWFRSQAYDIAAKAYGAPDLAHLFQLLQPLLAERFQLAVHHETRDMPVFALIVESRGLKMKPSIGPPSPDVPTLSGRLNATRAQLTGQHATMKQLVSMLTVDVGRPVIDKTGLTGLFDFKLEWSPDNYQLSRTMPVAIPPSAGADPSALSLFTAIREQLGLRLESQKGPGDVLVIDHVQRIPSAN